MDFVKKLSGSAAAVLLALAAAASPADAQAGPLTYEQAKAAAEAAEVVARQNGWNVTILVADADGVPMYVKRLDGASARSFEIALRKARTSAATGLTTAGYGERVEGGGIEEVPDGVTFAGGVPILVGNQILGGIGTSGVAAENDEVVSQAGVTAIVD